MDKVLIRQLRVDTVIGVYDWEKKIQQSLFLDLDMAWDNKPAAMGDDYQFALCYETVSKRITQLITEQPIELIETVAERVAECLLGEFNVAWVKVVVMKPGAVATAASVGVEIERSQPTSVES
ncbi:dihydroneopterin aldolase [Shewanella sp. CG12_big_fil_rev_8_21_14_0_65_47_15]|uniref:dihydroneopterin aldolase n=1 Tax=Shewanella sp. CG12_big_fil_rev_8_21_14_0_65_47_15 TaxID=1975537 RepID=UPI000CBB39C4|nr:dihydroneopterin aldolase [Shewanella sp. CG12_big_fil_rev_8_21_14_0_65_47_15]PIW59358.1 MAG: dihydroneopterin aldolase [Shewanella sp. CG12_big_fil_rev_8_21_14_0_65_47_15]